MLHVESKIGRFSLGVDNTFKISHYICTIVLRVEHDMSSLGD